MVSSCGFGSRLRCSRVAFFFSVTTTPDSDTRRPGQRPARAQYCICRQAMWTEVTTADVFYNLHAAGAPFPGPRRKHPLSFSSPLPASNLRVRERAYNCGLSATSALYMSASLALLPLANLALISPMKHE
ncbi:hypothetical protein PGTUg99_000684 [Puccinia graminis f. sp. tritici]|uniref:Uncharacterized protein n=1 Tax=Puccinia graminis f. sp. tritici TaxID=56615 RepID=A0A5B0S3P1_PUCGR|nr:hypothetical protein PGTUg99_000684 [Puccinia graminis f. sp. tritici]